jgi:CheY-like chemotaxis protein/predicted regulator of Ras-like GTPase activity (Roadblock/LC7/MglB family)
MDTILIVDDNKDVLDILTQGLEIYRSQFEVVTASDGAEAVKILNKQTISLVVSDLMMPNIGGLQLIAYMTQNFQAIPCIVMVESGTSKIDDTLVLEGALHCIEKPFKIKEIAALIMNGLDLLDEGATRNGIGISSFLLLIEMVQMSCLIKIRSTAIDNGLLYFERGMIWYASYRKLEPEEAAIEILTWNKVEISFLALPRKKYKQCVFSDLKTLIAKAREKSEKKEALENLSIPAYDLSVTETSMVCGSQYLRNENNMEDDHGIDQIDQEYFLEVKPGQKGVIEEKLSDLKKLKGFMSAGVFSPGGEIIAGIYDHSAKFEQTGDFMFNMVEKAQKIFKILELGSCNMIDITAEGGQHLLIQSYHRDNINYVVALICSDDAETKPFKHHFGLIASALVEYLKVR